MNVICKTYSLWKILKFKFNQCSLINVVLTCLLSGQCNSKIRSTSMYLLHNSHAWHWHLSTHKKHLPNQWFSHWNNWVSAVSWIFLFLSPLLHKLETRQQRHRCDPLSLVSHCCYSSLQGERQSDLKYHLESASESWLMYISHEVKTTLTGSPPLDSNYFK